MTKLLQEKTRHHYDHYPFIEGGPDRIAWWQEYLRDFLPDESIRNRFIIDVGSGIGEISRGLINRGARLVCLDVSLESLRRCRQINEEASIFHGSALELPFADASFDHAISIGVLHHTPDCRRGFHEVARVTAPGGTVVIFLYNYWNIYDPIYHAFWPVRKLLPLDNIPPWMVRSLQPLDASSDVPLRIPGTAMGPGGWAGLRGEQEILPWLRECDVLQETWNGVHSRPTGGHVEVPDVRSCAHDQRQWLLHLRCLPTGLRSGWGDL